MSKVKFTQLASLIVFVFAIIILSATKVLAEDAAVAPKTLFGDYLKELGVEITGSATMDFYDKYVWRGQYLDRDAVVQPGVSFSAKGFTLGYWASLPVENADPLQSNESDYYASYTYTIDKVSLTGGHTWYQFPGTSTSSKEFYFTLAAATFLNPSVSFYHDYEDGKDLNTDGSGNYWALSVAQSVPLIKEYNISLELGATYGYIDGQWLSGQGSHLTPTLGVKLPLTANLSIVPTLAYNVTMGDLKDKDVGNQESKFFGGVKSSFTF